MSAQDANALATRAFGTTAIVAGDIVHLSDDRAFAHAEDRYDAQYENSSIDLAPGSRLVDFLKEFGIAKGARLLEIGCGTGFLSLGVAASNYFDEVAVTDGSLNFMRLTKAKFEQIDTQSNICLAVLTDHDIDKIADDYFDVIAMRSVLHHVTDFGEFADMLMKKLRPRGVLAMFEPRAELFLWMGTVMAMFSELAVAKKVHLDAEDRESISIFVRTIEFYLRRDIDKSQGEDKYAFWQHEMLDMASRNHAVVAFRSENEATDLVVQLLHYCRYCMGFSSSLVEKLRVTLSSLDATVAGFLMGVRPPDLAGWYIFSKS